MTLSPHLMHMHFFVYGRNVLWQPDEQQAQSSGAWSPRHWQEAQTSQNARTLAWQPKGPIGRQLISIQYAFNMDSIWIQCGPNKDLIWIQYDFNMDLIWT